MKKLFYLVAPLMCFSALVGCNKTEKFLIDFNTNDKDTYIEPLYVAKGTRIKEPVLTRDNYIYRGWYIDEELLNPFDFSKGIQNNYTLNCKWDVDPDHMVRFKFQGFGCEINNENNFFEDIELGDSRHYRINTINDSFTLPANEEVDTGNEDIVYDRYDLHFATLDIKVNDTSKPYDLKIRCESDEYCYLGINMTNCTIDHSSYFVITEKKNTYLKYNIIPAPNYRLPSRIECLYPSSSLPGFVDYNQEGGFIEINGLEKSVVLNVSADYIAETSTVCFECTNCSGRFSLEKDFQTFKARTFEVNSSVAIQIKNGPSSDSLSKDDIKFYVNGVEEEDGFEFDPVHLTLTFKNTGIILVKVVAKIVADATIEFYDDGFDFTIDGVTYKKEDKCSVIIPKIYGYVIVNVEITKTDKTEVSGEDFVAYSTHTGQRVETVYDESDGKGHLFVYVAENVYVRNLKEDI